MNAVGILGAGQLGLMLAESLDRLGAPVVIFDPENDSPCSLRRSNVMLKSLNDPQAVDSFFQQCAAVTYESENIPVDPLRSHGDLLVPSLDVLSVCQHRSSEKRFLDANGFRPVHFKVVLPNENLKEAIERFGYPLIVKSTRGGYDGKGQFRINGRTEIDRIRHLEGTEVVLEEVLTLHAEISCIVARDRQKKSVSFPIFENKHTNHILDFTVVPARVDAQVQEQASQTALAIAEALDLVGLLTVEFFVGTGRDDRLGLFVNELAPRVHNSGHITRQCCAISQFDVSARILMNVPLHQPQLRPGGWAMGQLLGDVWLAQRRSSGAIDLTAWANFPEVIEIYLYGKKEARRDRKMGHFIVHALTADLAERRAIEFRDALMRQVP